MHDVGQVPTLQFAKKSYRAKLDHNANVYRYELARGRTRARTEAAENVESLWKAVFLLLRSPSVSQLLRQNTLQEGNRNEGNEEAFSSDQAAVTEGEEIEPETVKDAECQTIEFH